jgi:hypothetical protein
LIGTELLTIINRFRRRFMNATNREVAYACVFESRN